MMPSEMAKFPIGTRVEICFGKRGDVGVVTGHRHDCEVKTKINGVTEYWAIASSLKVISRPPPPSREEVATAIGNLDRILEATW